MLLRGPGSSNHSLFWGKPVPSRDIQSFFIYSSYILQKRKSCDEVVDGLVVVTGVAEFKLHGDIGKPSTGDDGQATSAG